MDILDFGKENIVKGMSCKFIEDNHFICGIIVGSKLDIYDFLIDNVDIYIDIAETLLSVELFEYLSCDSFSSLGLYDTDKNNIKLLCRQRNQEINCYFIKITINEESSIELIGDENIVFTTSNDFTEKNCYFSEFDNQYLFCCGIKDMIKCYIIKKDIYTILNEFKISMLGDNSYLTIKINNGCANLFFMNANNNINNVYGYYICIPECNAKLFYRIVNSLNEDGDNGKLNDLVNIKTNNYYFEIIDNIDDIGYFTLNDEKLKQRHLINNNDILDFIVTKEGISTNTYKYVKFKVSVEEEMVYPNICDLELLFIACYYSCSKCNKDAINSTHKRHNCITCKENFYKSPDNNNNCFSIDKKQKNWYFDEINNEFGLCNEACLCSCTGPTKSDCLECYEEFDLDISLNEFKNQIINDITSYTEASYFFNGTDFLAMILSSDNLEPVEQFKKGITSFDLGNCTNVLKEHYKIKKEKI